MSSNTKELYIKIKADAKDIVKDFDKSISAIENAAEKINLGSDFQKQIDEIKADIDEIRNFSINPHVDYTQVDGLAKVIDRIRNSLDFVNGKVNAQKKMIDSSKIKSEIDTLNNSVDSAKSKASELYELIESMFDIKKVKDSQLFSDGTLKNLEQAKKSYKELGKVKEELDSKNSSVKDVGDLDAYYSKRAESLKNELKGIDTLKKKQEKNPLDRSVSNAYRNSVINAGKIAKELKDAQSELSIVSPSKEMVFSTDDLNNYINQAKAQIDNTRHEINNYIKERDPLNLADVTSFELKDGVIKVPVDLDAEGVRNELTELVNQLKNLVEPVVVPLEFETKGRKANIKETSQYKKLVEQIDSVTDESFNKADAKKKLDDLAARYSKAMTVSLKFEKTEAKKSINKLLSEIKSLIDEANIGQSLYEGIEKSLLLLGSEMEVVFGNNLIDNWANHFISTIDLVCSRIDQSFKSITDNNVYAALKGWESADKVLRTSRIPGDNVNKYDTRGERTAYGETERIMFANYKTGKTTNPYYHDQKFSSGGNLLRGLVGEIEKSGKTLGEQFDTYIHSHPIIPRSENGERYSPIGSNNSFSKEDLKLFQTLWQQGIRRMVVESNGMLNTFDLSMYGDKAGKNILDKIVKEYEKATVPTLSEISFANENGEKFVDYSKLSKLENEKLAKIINSKSRVKNKNQILTQQTVDSLRLDVNQFSNESQEINNLTQTILRMAEAIDRISSEGITSHATEDFFSRLHAEIDSVVQSVNNLAKAFENVAISAGSMSQSVGQAASNIDLVGEESQKTENKVSGGSNQKGNTKVSDSKSQSVTEKIINEPTGKKVNPRDLARAWIGQQFGLTMPDDTSIKSGDLEIKPSNAVIISDDKGNIRLSSDQKASTDDGKKSKKTEQDKKDKKKKTDNLPYDIDNEKFKANRKLFDVFKSEYPNHDENSFPQFLATKAISPKYKDRERIFDDIAGGAISPGLVKEVQKELISIISNQIGSLEDGTSKYTKDMSMELIKNAEELYMELNPKANFGRLLSQSGLREKQKNSAEEYYRSRGYDFITGRDRGSLKDDEVPPSMLDAYGSKNYGDLLVEQILRVFGIEKEYVPKEPAKPNPEGFSSFDYKTLSERKIEARNKGMPEKEYSSPKFARDAIVEMIQEGALPFTKGINAIDAHSSYIDPETHERVDLGLMYENLDIKKITGFLDNLISMFGEYSRLIGRSNPSELKNILRDSGIKSDKSDELFDLVTLRAQELSSKKEEKYANLRKISQDVFGYKDEPIPVKAKKKKKSKKEILEDEAISKSIEVYEKDLLSKKTPSSDYRDLAKYFFGSSANELKGKSKGIYDRLQNQLKQNNQQRIDFSRETVSRIARTLSLPTSNGTLDGIEVQQLERVVSLLKEYEIITGRKTSLKDFLGLEEIGNDAAVADKALDTVVGRLEKIEGSWGKKPSGKKQIKESKKLSDAEKNQAWKDAQNKVKQHVRTNPTGEFLVANSIGDKDIKSIVDIYGEYQKKVGKGAKSIRNLMDGRGIPIDPKTLDRIVLREHQGGYTSKEFDKVRHSLTGIRNIAQSDPSMEKFGKRKVEQQALYDALKNFQEYENKGGYETLDYLLENIFTKKNKDYNVDRLKKLILNAKPYDPNATIKGESGYYWTPTAEEKNKTASSGKSSGGSTPPPNEKPTANKPSKDVNGTAPSINYDGEPITVPITFDYAKAIEELKSQLIAVCTALPIGFSESLNGTKIQNSDSGEVNSVISDIENLCKSLLSIFESGYSSNDEYKVARDISESIGIVNKNRKILDGNPSTYGGLEFAWFSNSKTGLTSNPFYYDQSNEHRFSFAEQKNGKYDTQWHSHPSGENKIVYDDKGVIKGYQFGSSYMFSTGDFGPYSKNVENSKKYKTGLVSADGKVTTLDLREFTESQIRELFREYGKEYDKAHDEMTTVSWEGKDVQVPVNQTYKYVKNKKTGDLEPLWEYNKKRDNGTAKLLGYDMYIHGEGKNRVIEPKEYTDRSAVASVSESAFRKAFASIFPDKNVDDYLKIGTVEDFKKELPDFSEGYKQANEAINLLDVLKSKLSDVSTESGEISNLGGDQNPFGQFCQVISQTIDNISALSQNLKGIADAFNEMRGVSGEGSPIASLVSDLNTLSSLNIDGVLGKISTTLSEFSTNYNRMNGVITDSDLKSSYENLKGLSGQEKIDGLNQLMSQYQEYSRTGGQLKFSDLEKDAGALNLIEEEYAKFISNQEKLNQEMKETPSIKSIFSDGDFEKFNTSINNVTQSLSELVVELKSFADMYQRVTGVTPGKILEQDFANIQSSFNTILNDPKQGNIGNIHVGRKSFKKDLMEQYYQYVSRGGNRSIEDLTDDRIIKSKLSDTYASYLEKNRKIEVQDANLPSVYDEASLKTKITSVFQTLQSSLDSLIGTAEKLADTLIMVEPFSPNIADRAKQSSQGNISKSKGKRKTTKDDEKPHPDVGTFKDIGADTDAWQKAVEHANEYLWILNEVEKVEQRVQRNKADDSLDISYALTGTNGNKIIMGQSGRLLQSFVKDSDYSSILTPYLKALSKSLTGQKRSITEQSVIAELNKFNEMIPSGSNKDILSMIAQKYKFSGFNEKDFRNTASSLNEGAIKSIVNGLNSDVRKLEQPLIKNPNEAYFDQLNRIRDIIKEISNSHLDLFDPQDAIELQNMLNGVESIKAELKQNKSAYKSADNDKINQLERQIAEFRNANSKAFLNDDVAFQFDLLGESIKNVKSEADLTEVKAQFEGLRHEIVSTGQDGLTFFDNWKKRMRGLAGYLSTFFNFYQIINAVRTGIQNVRELDAAFIEMQKVSNDSEQSLKNFADRSFEMGSSVGATGLQMQKSAADWMRLGESITEAQKSAAISNELLQISEFEDIDSATQSLVAVSQAYRDLDKIEIVDKLNNIGNNFSISTNELAEGLQRASATLLTQGNTLDEAIALITAGNNTIQDSARVAAGIKTISLRIAGTEEAKEELSSEGEDVEDYVVMTRSKKRDIIKDYTAVASNEGRGVDILDENGNYKSTYQILKEISEVYKEIQAEDKKLGTNRASALIEELAGKNRSNIAAAILQNGELLEKVKDYSMDSEGSAQKELDKQLESLDTKIVQITNDLQELSKLVIPTDLFKGLLEGADALLDLLNKILGSNGVGFSGLIGLLSGVGVSMTGHGIAGKNGNLFNWLPTLFQENIYKEDPKYSMLKKSVNASDMVDSKKIRAINNQSLNDYLNRTILESNTRYEDLFSGNFNTDDLVRALSLNGKDMDSTIDVDFLKSLKIDSVTEYLDELIAKTQESGESLENIDYQSFFEGFEQSAIESGEGVSLFSLSIDKAKEAIKSFAASMITTLAFSAIFIGIAKLAEIIDHEVIHKFEYLQDASSKAFAEYSNTKSELDDLNAKLEETSGKINQLESQGSITITEQIELDKLKLENEELQRQINLKEELAKQEQKEATDLTVDEVTNSYIVDPTTKTNTTSVDESGHEFVVGVKYERNTPIQVAKNEIDKLRELSAERQKYLDIYNDDTSSSKQKKDADERIKSLDKEISEYETLLTDLIPSLENAREQLADDTTDSGKKTFELLTDIIDDYNDRNKSALEVASERFEKLMSSEGDGVEELKEKLALGAKEGLDLGQVLGDLGIKISDIPSESLSVLSEYFNDVKAGVISLDDEVKTLSLDIDSLISDESSALSRIEKAFGSEASEKGDTYAAMLERIKTAKELVESGDVGTEKFKSIASFFSPTGAEDLDDWKENLPKISKYFTENQDGVYNFLDDLTKVLKDQGAKIEDGFYNFPDYFDAEEVGRKLGIGGEAVVTLMGEAMDKGLSQDFFTDSEGGFNTLIGLENELAEAQLEYNKLQSEGASETRLDAQKEKIEDLKIRIGQCTDSLDAMFKKFEDNSGKDGKAPITDEDRKVLSDYTKRYNDLNNREWKTETERKQWETHRGQLGQTIIQTAAEKGVTLDYNKRGQLVEDVDKSNQILENYATAIKTATDSTKEGTKEQRDAIDYISKESKKRGISEAEFTKRYSEDKWLTENQLTELKQTEIENNSDAVNENTNAISTLADAINALSRALGVNPEEPNEENTRHGGTSGKFGDENDKGGTSNKKTKAGFDAIVVNAGEVPEGYVYRKRNKTLDLTHRPIVSSEYVSEAGWGEDDGKTSTVLTSRRSDENGNQFVFTPILPNGEVYEKKNFDSYMDSVINGGDDEYNLLIASFSGEGAEKAASDYEEALHLVQDAYFTRDEAARESLNVLQDYTAEELRAVDLTDDSTSEMEDSFTGLMESLGITSDQAEQFINVMQDMGLLKVAPQIDLSGVGSVDELNQTLSSKLDTGQSITYTADIDGAEGDVTALKDIDGTIKYTVKDKDGTEKEVEPLKNIKDGTITYHVVPDKEDKGQIDNKNKDGGTATVKTNMDTTGFDKGKKEVSQGVQTLAGKEAKPKVNLQGAVAASNQLSSVKQKMNSLNGKESKVTLTTVKKTIIKTERGNHGKGGTETEFNGTFHISNAHAGGTASTNVSIQKDENALINELGKEIVVRNGKAMTFNNGYPTFANLKRGDIVFNHKQTEELEEKGYVTGSHAKIYGGESAFATGTVVSNAYARTSTSRKKSSSSKDSSKNKSTGGKGKTTKKKKGSSKKGKNTWEKFEEWLSNLFDWVEIRLDNLSKKTEAWTNLFEKFLNAASDNAQAAYNAALSAARNEQTYAYKASDRYLEEAIDVGLEGAKAAGTTGKGKKKKRKISDDWVMNTYERLLNDDLSESEIGKLDDKKKSIVDAMKDYIDKARDAADSTVELTESINDLIIKQRDAKVEFRKNAFSSAVEGNKGYTSATKNSVLTQSSATAEYSNNQYASTLASQESQFNTLSSNALSVSSASASSNKKVLSKLKGAKKNTYISNLNSASSAIKAKKAVSESVINYFRKMNPSVAAKYLAYNTQIALLENARAEAADNFAENMSTIIDNIAESYANLDEEAQQAIDLAQSRAENATSYTEANNILNEVYKLQDKILTNNQSEINKYNSLLNSYKPNINTSNYKGTMFGSASQSVQTAVAKARNAAVSAVSQNKMIPDSVMVQLYDYLSKGYITLSFYQSCRSWNMVFAQGEQAQAQLKIDQETAKKEKLNTFRTQTGNIESNYSDRVSEAEAIKGSIAGNYEDSITQGNIIKLRIQEANELQVALQNALDTGVIKKGDSAWYEYSIKIQEARNEVEKLKQTQFETELAEQFDRAIEKAQQFIDKLETINDLIADEMLYDNKSGKMTDMGWMSLGLNSQAMAKEQDVLEKYLKERDVILKAYQEGNNSFFGDQSFDEMIEENAKNILSSISSINSFKESILDLIEGLAEAELKALQKVVDKRKEALQKKKESIIGSHIFNCWKTLKLFKLQHRDEIYSSANAMKIEKIE